MTERPSALAFGPISAAASGPLYEQIVAAVKREVEAGRLASGDALPSLRVLAADLLVSLITVKRAYEELERDGVIFSRQGLGAFVAERGPAQVRRQRVEAVNAALATAVEAGTAAGFSDADLIDMLKIQLLEGREP